MKGKFVLIEGLDGIGKSTLVEAITGRLRAYGEDVLQLAFPSRASAIGALIRDVFEGKQSVHPDAMLWLFAAEAKDMDAQIRTRIANGHWTIVDRHMLLSTMVYQTLTHGKNRVCAVVDAANCQLPDYIFLLDAPAKVALERRKARGIADNPLFESDRLDKLESMRRDYLDLRAQFPSMVVLDGTKTPREILDQVCYNLGLP